MKKNILIKLFCSILTINSFTYAEKIAFDVKFLKLPELSYVDLLTQKYNKTIYNQWLLKDKNPFTFITNVKEEYAVKSFSIFYKNYCSKDLSEKNEIDQKTCFLMAPGVSRDFDFKQINILDSNDIFRKKPIMYMLNNELGFIVIDLTDKYYSKPDAFLELELNNIENLFKQFENLSGLKKDQIILLGNFGTSEKNLEKYINKNKFVIHSKEFSELTKINSKIRMANSVYAITYKEGKSLVKNMNFEYNIHLLDKKNKSLNKKEEMDYIFDRVSNYYPLTLKISYDFKSLNKGK